ncbi:MAG: hypothetical protein AB9897_09640 [Anaerolineaceae bacterium]
MTKIRILGLILLPILLSSCQVINSLQPVATAAAPGSVLLEDGFSDNENHWGISDGDKGKVSFLYQGLDIMVEQPNSMIWTVNGEKYQDVKIDIDAVLLNGPTDDAYGAICRYQDNEHFYGFLVTHDGYYGIFKMQQGQLVLANPEGGLKFSEAIRQGGVVNHIQAICQGNLLTLSVNDQILSIIEDDSLSQGKIGLIAGAYATPGVELFFDNLKVTQP